VALALEDCTSHLAVHFAIKGKIAAGKGEGGRIPVQHQVIDRDDFIAGLQAAQLLIGGIAVGWMLGRRDSTAIGKKKDRKQARQTNAMEQGAGSFQKQPRASL
jgi:hypothetical protein